MRYAVDNRGRVYYKGTQSDPDIWWDVVANNYVDIIEINRYSGPITELNPGKTMEFFEPLERGTDVRMPVGSVPGNGGEMYGYVLDYSKERSVYKVVIEVPRDDVLEDPPF